MHLAWDLLAAGGVAVAVGVRPFLPVLVVGALGSAHWGVNFSGSSFAFLQSWEFLAAIVVLVAVTSFIARRDDGSALDRRSLILVSGGLAIGLAGLEGAGILAKHHLVIIAGCAIAVICAAITFVTVNGLLRRTKQRLDPQAARLLPVYAETIAILVSAISVLLPPASVVFFALVIWLLVASRRRKGQKYAGLRVLR